jgi:endonuclease/exonuclease/phosphatase family metal-dependent hydrolase
MGDFNDFDSQSPDASKNQPTSRVLSTFADLGLRNVIERLPPRERFTWTGNDYPRAALDHAFVDPELWHRLGSVWVDRNITGASDHSPLVFSIDGLGGAVDSTTITSRGGL